MRAILILLVAVVVLGLGAYGVWMFLTPSSADPIPESVPVAALEDDTSGPEAADVDTPAVTPSTTRTEMPAAPVTAPPTNVMPATYRAALSGIRGRLVEEDGTPVPDLPVDLLEIQAAELIGSNLALFRELAEKPPQLEVDSAVTGEDGTFVLEGAEMRAFHGLGIDLGGERATLRVIDTGLQEGQTRDLGDIVLTPFVTFTGHVVDPAGEPVANARVRATLLPPIVFQAGVTDVRPDSALFVAQFMGGETPEVMEFPSWVVAYESRLPIPTTYTAEDGSFRLEGVPQGVVTVAADKRGYTGAFRAMPSGRSGERKFPTLMLSRGQTLAGRVVDAGGTPVPGVEVIGGVLMSFGYLGIAQRGGSTGADGSFSIPGIAENGPAYVAARTHPAHPWRVIGPLDNPGNTVIEMEATATMRVRLTDMDGQAVPEAELLVQPASMMSMIPIAALRPQTDYRSHVRKVEDGVYEVRDLPLGAYRILGRSPGYGIASAEAPLTLEMLEHELRFPPGVEVHVRVLDETTREPVEWARVALLKDGQFGEIPLDHARTNHAGEALLGPAPDLNPRELKVWANHPAYANRAVPVADDPAVGTAEAPIELLVNGGGTLEGRVHYNGRAVDPPHMIILEPRDHDHPDNEIPRFAVTDAEGNFRFENLSAGNVRYEVFERFLFLDPQALIQGAINENFDPDTLARGTVEIAVGENEFLDLNLDPSALGAPASIVGVIYSAPGDEATYDVSINGEADHTVEVVAGEQFRIEGLPPGSYWTSVRRQEKDGEGTRNSQVHQARVDLSPGEVRTLDVVLEFFDVEIQVVHRHTGTPVPTAEVSVHLLAEGSYVSFAENTGPDGLAVIEVTRRGRYRVDANKNGLGMGHAEVNVPSERPIVVELDPGVPCAGRIEFDESKLDPEAEEIYLSFLMSTSDTSIRSVQHITLPVQERNFEVFGLQPGEYHLWMWAGETRSGRWSTFQLPPGGATNLVIRLNLR